MSDYEPKCKKTLPIIFDDKMPASNLTPKLVGRVNDNTEDLKNLYEETETIQGDIESLQEDVDDKLDIPETAGTAGQVLTSDGEGGAVWASVGSGEIVVDPTLTVEGAAADAKKTGDEITHLKQDISELRKTAPYPVLYNGFKQIDGNGYYDTDGTIAESSLWSYCLEYIPIVPGETYRGWVLSDYIGGRNVSVAWYTVDKKFISRALSYYAITAPDNAYFCRISIKIASADASSEKGMFVTGSATPQYYVPYSIDMVTPEETALSETIQAVSDSNIPLNGASYDYEDVEITEENGYYSHRGKLETANNWKHAEVNVEGGQVYYFVGSAATAVYALMVFDDYHRIMTVPETLGTAQVAQAVRLPASAKKVIINKNATGIVLKKAVSMSLSSGDDEANILYAKKLYCGGDSITEGANVGSFPNGYKKTYGGYTAVRNSMTYVADGVGGSTMGKCTIDGSVHNNFITSRYQNIPTDADFITLWFGWNDNTYGWQSARDAYCVATYGTYYSALTSAQKDAVDAYKTWREWLAIYAGTKDSTDITTWGGAWNTVLTWLLNNCGTAHIGVVIAYGIQDDFINVLIAICEKYGVSYVKAYDPHEFFSVGHSQGIGTDQATKRKSLYTLDNTHPNELGYEMMSASYEQFLKRL